MIFEILNAHARSDCSTCGQEQATYALVILLRIHVGVVAKSLDLIRHLDQFLLLSITIGGRGVGRAVFSILCSPHPWALTSLNLAMLQLDLSCFSRLSTPASIALDSLYYP